jgi:hypothetical protein
MVKMISEAYRSRAGRAEFSASRFARLAPFLAPFRARVPLASRNRKWLIDLQRVKFFIAIAAK